MIIMVILVVMEVDDMITSILSADITRYADNGQTIAYIQWRDARGQIGTTSGHPKNAHMQALLARAEREGVTVTRSR